VPKSKCTQSVTPEVASGMTFAMQKVMKEGTGQGSYYATSPNVPMIGKTGTTDGAADTWMSGASSKVATVVGVVSVTGKISQRKMHFDNGEQVSLARHRMWPDIMSVANAKYGGEAFPEPSFKLIQAPQVTVPDVRGKSMDEAKSILSGAGFDPVDGGVTDSELPEGTVASTDPAGGSRTGRGSTITIHTSNGKLKVLPDVVGKTEAEAKAALAEFKVESKEQGVTDPAEVGKVISMEPGAGTGIEPGGKVTILIGKLTADPGKKP